MSISKKNSIAPLPVTSRGRAIQLDADPKGKNFLYVNGRSVIIRDLANPELSKEYTQHNCNVNVARYAPTGFYIASGDIHGNVRIWDTLGEENILKSELPVFAGKVNDIAWDFESKRIIAVGEGKETFGRSFLFDTLSSVGEISGHTKAANSISIRSGRPLRAVSGADDNTVIFYTGVPFKFNKTIRDHSSFVQSVRYSPNGDFFATAGSDGKLFLYEGKEGNLVADLSTKDNAHSGGIFSLSWSADSKQLLSSSADRTTKLWDISAQSVVQTWEFGSTFQEQQVGNLWSGDYKLSVSLNGDINYLDATSGSITKTITGHQKGITSIAISDDRKTFWSGSYDGVINKWNIEKPIAEPLKGDVHQNQIQSISPIGKDDIITIGLDDSVREAINGEVTTVTSSASAPKGGSVLKDKTVIVLANQNIVAVHKPIGSKPHTFKVPFEASALTVSPNEEHVLIGAEDGKIHVYKTSDILAESGEKISAAAVNVISSQSAIITSFSYSPDGSSVAVSDSNRKIYVYDSATFDVKLDAWVYHTAKILTVTWSPDGKHAASGGIDSNLEVWSVEFPKKHINFRNAHINGITSVAWVDDNTVITGGGDSLIKTWEIKHVTA